MGENLQALGEFEFGDLVAAEMGGEFVDGEAAVGSALRPVAR